LDQKNWLPSSAWPQQGRRYQRLLCGETCGGARANGVAVTQEN
jgi:hypothetical protein